MAAVLSGLSHPMRKKYECGAVGGMRIDRENQSIERKPAPMPLFPQQIPRDFTWDRTRAAAVGSRRLTAPAMTHSSIIHKIPAEYGKAAPVLN
jgi:hypothetical protein